MLRCLSFLFTVIVLLLGGLGCEDLGGRRDATTIVMFWFLNLLHDWFFGALFIVSLVP